MKDNEFVDKIYELDMLSKQVKGITERMNELKADILLELDERKVEKFECADLHLVAVVGSRTTNPLVEGVIKEYFSKLDKEVPAEFYRGAQTSRYAMVKTLK